MQVDIDGTYTWTYYYKTVVVQKLSEFIHDTNSLFKLSILFQNHVRLVQWWQ